MFSLGERTYPELEKKIAETQSAYDEDLGRRCKERRKKLEAEKQEKRDAELVAYDPWGKPGGGAPLNNNTRRVNTTGNNTTGLHRSTNMNGQESPFGKPGAGAPLKTHSGKLRTKTNVDPEIRFQKRDREQVGDIVCPHAKYSTKSPLMTDLDMLAKSTREERNVIKRDRESSSGYQYYDPFGKPGAGAPNRDNNGRIAASRTFNLARTVQESHPKTENDQFNNEPKWNAFLKHQHLNKGGNRYIDGEELDESSRVNIAKHEIEILGERKECLKHADTWNNIWGRQGSGAPLESSRHQNVDMLLALRKTNSLF